MMDGRIGTKVTLEEAYEEIDRLKAVFPVVRLLDEKGVTEDSNCLLCGEGCPCMRRVCEELLEAHTGKETRQLRMGDNDHKATARYLEVDGKPHVLLYATPLETGDEAPNGLLYIDPLTGVYNRRFYEEKMRKQRMYAGVAVIDLDDFKLVNDTLGHHTGDLALKTAAQAMRSRVRESDMLMRYGGDEFVLVLPNISADAFRHKLNTITEAVAKTSVPGYDQMALSASIGGVLSNGSTVEEAVKQADNLMYRAKQHRNSVLTDADTEAINSLEFRKPLVLIVDDAEMNREILREMLKDEYEIIEASNGREGVEKLVEYGAEISIMLLDIVMPEMDGFAVLSRMVRSGWIEDIPVIMISSEDSDEAVLRAYELGASDYISRPFDMRVVRQRVSNIMRLYAKQRRLSALLQRQFFERQKDSNVLVNIMGGAMELRNGESGPHVLHVRNLTEILLERLVQKTDDYSISAVERSTIAMASTLHDIGKLAIPDNILNKPGKLTDEEFEIMKTHTTLGSEMLSRLDMYTDSPLLLQTAHDICRWHHERWDGRGYPDGLKGDEIPISAQAVSIADVYDALTSERVYKSAVSHEKAIEMILNNECGVFNPMLIECLLDVQDRIKQDYEATGLTPPNFSAN
jgi:putative two-component system response regulator